MLTHLPLAVAASATPRTNLRAGSLAGTRILTLNSSDGRPRRRTAGKGGRGTTGARGARLSVSTLCYRESVRRATFRKPRGDSHNRTSASNASQGKAEQLEQNY